MRGPGAHRPTVPVGTGQFAGRVEPQAADLRPAEELVDSLLAGGLGVALTTASNRHFTGGDFTPQTFLAPPSHPNDDNSLSVAPSVGAANFRRAVNRHRGRFPIA